MSNTSTLTNEGGEHVPRLSVDDRANQKETIGGRERDDDVAERRIVLNEVSKAAPAVESMGDRHVDGVSGAPQSDDVTETKEEYCDTISHLGTLRAITERANSDHEEKGNVELENDIEDDPAGTVKLHEREGICS